MTQITSGAWLEVFRFARVKGTGNFTWVESTRGIGASTSEDDLLMAARVAMARETQEPVYQARGFVVQLQETMDGMPVERLCVVAIPLGFEPHERLTFEQAIETINVYARML